MVLKEIYLERRERSNRFGFPNKTSLSTVEPAEILNLLFCIVLLRAGEKIHTLISQKCWYQAVSPPCSWQMNTWFFAKALQCGKYMDENKNTVTGTRLGAMTLLTPYLYQGLPCK